MHKVKLLLSLLGGWAERQVTMPIMPVGSLIDCVPELDRSLEISHWVVAPASDEHDISIVCHLVVDDWGVDEQVEPGGETFSEWLSRVGFTVHKYRHSPD